MAWKLLKTGMGRKPRILQTEYPYHATIRTNDREFRFERKKTIKVFAQVLVLVKVRAALPPGTIFRSAGLVIVRAALAAGTVGRAQVLAAARARVGMKLSSKS